MESDFRSRILFCRTIYPKTGSHFSDCALTAGAINALGLALIISGMVFPVVRAGAPEALARPFTWIWVLAGMTLHVIAHVVLGLLKNEG